MRVQPFQNKFARRSADLIRFVRSQPERACLFHQALNGAEFAHHLGGVGIGTQFQRAADIEPLNDRLHIDTLEIAVVNLAHGCPDQFPTHRVAAFKFAFVFQFDFSGNCRKRRVDVDHTGNGQFFLILQCAPLRIRYHVFGDGNRQSL